MRTLFYILSLSLFFCASGFAKGDIKFGEAEERSWTHQFAAIYEKAHNYGELIDRLPTLSGFDKTALKLVLKPSQALPKLEIKDGFLFAGKTSLKIISLNDRSFLINGRTFTYDPSASTIYNLNRINNLLNQKNSMLQYLLPDANAEELNSDLISNSWSNPESINQGHGDMIAVGLSYNPLAALLVLPAHYLVTQVESSIAPSCEKQVDDLKDLLNKNHLGLEGIDCDGYIRDFALAGSDSKSVTFWTPQGVKKSFNADWVGSVAWDDPNHLYMFDQNQLTEYREINPKHNPSDKSSPKFFDYKEGSPQFATARNNVEPYRQVLKYLGTHRSCYKCQSEISKGLVSASPPWHDNNAAPIDATK